MRDAGNVPEFGRADMSEEHIAGPTVHLQTFKTTF